MPYLTHRAAYECIAVASATDFRPDPQKADVQALVANGDDDQSHHRDYAHLGKQGRRYSRVPVGRSLDDLTRTLDVIRQASGMAEN
jgi:hypothetical protein